MIDTKELRRLAQAATPGPWKLLTVGDRAKRFAVADINFLSVLTVAYECGTNFGAVYLDGDAAFIAAANPAAINELLDRLEAAESVLKDFGTTAQEVECWLERYRCIEREAEALRTRLEAAEADALEQARLNGMGAEREAALMAKLEAAKKENAKLREALVEKVVSETMLRDLSIRNGSINASFEGGAAHLLVDAFVEQFVESGAVNYLEMQFHSNVTGPLVVTLQRVNGKTAHQLRAEAEKERDALRARIEALEQQKPYAFAVAFPETSRVELVHDLDDLYEDMTTEAHDVRKLYLTPGAKGEGK